MQDANEDMRHGDIQGALVHIPLQEAIFVKHGNNAPLMYNKGRVLIDKIFVSPTLHIAICTMQTASHI